MPPFKMVDKILQLSCGTPSVKIETTDIYSKMDMSGTHFLIAMLKVSLPWTRIYYSKESDVLNNRRNSRNYR